MLVVETTRSSHRTIWSTESGGAGVWHVAFRKSLPPLPIQLLGRKISQASSMRGATNFGLLSKAVGLEVPFKTTRCWLPAQAHPSIVISYLQILDSPPTHPCKRRTGECLLRKTGSSPPSVPPVAYPPYEIPSLRAVPFLHKKCLAWSKGQTVICPYTRAWGTKNKKQKNNTKASIRDREVPEAPSALNAELLPYVPFPDFLLNQKSRVFVRS